MAATRRLVSCFIACVCAGGSFPIPRAFSAHIAYATYRTASHDRNTARLSAWLSGYRTIDVEESKEASSVRVQVRTATARGKSEVTDGNARARITLLGPSLHPSNKSARDCTGGFEG